MGEAAAASQTQTVRLHISPFSPALLDSIIPRTKQSLVKSVSYHTIQSEPDKGFGYLELPTDEADRLRKKLHGAILRGNKMSIDKARPEKRKVAQKEVEPEEDSRPSKKSKTGSKSKQSNKEISGVELPTDRKVKRGWTEPDSKASKKSKGSEESKGTRREKSRFTEKEELLFRTGKKEVDKKAKSKDGKKTRTKDQVIHEFEKTTKVPTFLKQDLSQSTGRATAFIDGKGWVDEDGKVVEAVRSQRRDVTAKLPSTSSTEAPLGIQGLPTLPGSTVEKKSSAKKARAVPGSHASSSSSSGSSVSSISSSESESDSESGSESDTDASASSQNQAPLPAVEQCNPSLTKSASGQDIAASTEMPTPALTGSDEDSSMPKPIHPLEALYKRRPEDLPKPAPINTSFSFFAADEDEMPTKADSTNMPQTPFTQQDLRFRGLRSAAPTPDTAVASRKFFADVDEDEDEDDDEQDETDPEAAKTTETNTLGNGTSAWRKAFYEKRSDLNQSWKQRRRDSMKQQRQRENRRLTRRAM
ncbi:hypothetical protein CAC42_4216 [Sphaceloma murrayae]|uniref:Uncharacterized protein n=1 Tax=Sphaceloma murrayae TaxID=2082308 RepID=A0A2K1QKT5_9PEZI|nr:hypothetical protein CAC42_4216 [Sphaceloma murrayae]